MNDDAGGRRRLGRPWSPGSGLFAIMTGIALLTAACSSGAANTPRVASLGNSSRSSATAGSSTSTPRTGNPTRLLDEWAACMRSHGDPGQADPTIGANKVIDVTISPGVQGGVYGYSGEYGPGGPGLSCRAYLTAAQTALRGGQPPPKVDEATLLKLAKCMRANGIPDFPDPTASGLTFRVGGGGDLNPNNPSFQNAAKLCARKTGADVPGSGTPPPGTVEIDGSGPGIANG
jgi:hypothetical protein